MSVIPQMQLVVLFAAILVTPARGMDRDSFAEKMRLLAPGDSVDRVRQVLGRPDNELKHDVDTATRMPAIAQVWYYGVAKDGFPTLGRVYFRNAENGMVVEQTYGRDPPPAAIREFRENELRELLSAMGRLPDPMPMYYDPRPMIAIVNRTFHYRKPQIAALIREFIRVTSLAHAGNAFRIQLYLRALCDPNPQQPYPPANLGQLSPEAPKDKGLLPYFPIHVMDDIPLLMIHSMSYEGDPPSPDDQLDWFQREGELRKAPLRPSVRPWTIRRRLEETTSWSYCERQDADRLAIICQILFLVGRHPRLYEDQVPRMRTAQSLIADKSWEEFERGMADKHWKWDEAKVEYVAVDRG
jgi:hypothetical protein